MLGDQADDPAGTPHRRARHAAPRRPPRVRVALGRRHRDLEGPLAPVGQHRDGPNGMDRVPVLRRHAALGWYRVVAQLEQWEAHRAALQDRVALRHPAEPDRLHPPLVLGPGGDGDHGHVDLRVRPRHPTLGGPLTRPVGVNRTRTPVAPATTWAAVSTAYAVIRYPDPRRSGPWPLVVTISSATRSGSIPADPPPVPVIGATAPRAPRRWPPTPCPRRPAEAAGRA